MMTSLFSAAAGARANDGFALSVARTRRAFQCRRRDILRISFAVWARDIMMMAQKHAIVSKFTA